MRFWRVSECKEVNGTFDIKNKIQEYVDLYVEIEKWEKNETVALVLLQEIAADRRASQKYPATDKQKKLMKDLKVEFSPGVTKRKASELIYKALQKQKTKQLEIGPINYGQ